MIRYQSDEPFSFGKKERAGTDEQRSSTALDQRRKRCFDVAVAADIKNDELLPDRSCGGLDVASLVLGSRMVRVDQYADYCRLGRELSQQLQPLCSQVVGEKDHPRDVVTRPVEPGDEAALDRIAPGQEHYRGSRSRCLNRKRRSAVGDYHGHLPAN